MTKQFKLITQAMETNQTFKKYIDIIKKESKEPFKDLQDLEYILQGHTVKQVTDFLPRFISLL